MNTKVIVLLAGAGAVHLAVGGLFLAGGCAQEDPPMPPGIYVPKQSGGINQPSSPEPASSAVPSTDPVFPESAYDTPMPEPAAKTEPQAKPASKAQSGERLHVVAKGDSLWKLARQNGLTIEELASYNNLPADAKLKIGQKIYIPASAAAAASAGTPAPKTKAPAQKKNNAKAPAKKNGAKTSAKKKDAAKSGKNLPEDGIYTVKAGDNFSTIAKRFGLKVSDIMSANPGTDSSRLKVGQKIRLTESAAPVAIKRASRPKKTAAPAAAKKESRTEAAAPAQGSSEKPASAVDTNKEIDALLKDDAPPAPAAPANQEAAPGAHAAEPVTQVPEKDRAVGGVIAFRRIRPDSADV